MFRGKTRLMVANRFDLHARDLKAEVLMEDGWKEVTVGYEDGGIVVTGLKEEEGLIFPDRNN